MHDASDAVGRKLYSVLDSLALLGSLKSPRGLKTLEARNFQFDLPVEAKFYNFPSRKLSMDYIKTEFQWYLKGDLYDLSIAKKAKLWGEIQEKGRVWSNYGHYIFRSPHGGLRWVLDELTRDPDSRRAVLPINQPFHLYEGNKDVPCTMYLNFWIDEDFGDTQLNMGVRMRSQDAWFGLGNDLPTFSWILELATALLNRRADGLYVPGRLNFHVDSFHVYERHFEAFYQLITDGPESYTPIDVPTIDPMSAEHMLHGTQETTIGKSYAFNSWLYSSDIKNTKTDSAVDPLFSSL